MKMSLGLRPALAAGLVLLAPALPTPAAGQHVPPGAKRDLAKVLPPVPGRKACYARTYDAAHLKKHPKQKVTALLFQLKYHRHPKDETYPQGARNYYFAMSAKVKGQPKTLYSSGECAAGETGFGCGPECDGGGVSIDLDPKGSALIIRLNHRIRMTLGCDHSEENTIDLEPGADDKIFRVEKASLSACRSLDRRM